MNALQEVTQSSYCNWLPAHNEGDHASSRLGEQFDLRNRPRHYSLFEDLERQLSEIEEEHRSDLQEIRKSFVLRDERAATSFIRAHRAIPRVLLEARSVLKKSFGLDTVFALKVLTGDDGLREMYVVAAWPGLACDAMRALDNLIESWWIERSGSTNGRLGFTYELE